MLRMLLEPRAAFRLTNPAQIAGHPFFAGVDWGEVAAGRMAPPASGFVGPGGAASVSASDHDDDYDEEEFGPLHPEDEALFESF